MSTEQRVPAWKRLGLSLTNAKDTAPAPASPATSTKRSRDDPDTSKASKKQRLDQSQNGVNVSSPAPAQFQPSSVAPISSPMPSRMRASPEKSILATPNSKQGRRKSVVFSNDTKKQDGDSAQTYFQAWANDELEYYAQKAAAYDAAEAAKAEETKKAAENTATEPSQSKAAAQQPDVTPRKTQKDDKSEKSIAKEDQKKSKADKKEGKKKEKKSEHKAEEAGVSREDTAQSASDPSAPVVKKQKVRTPKDNTNKPVPEYVRYLEQYHTDRPAWKFNKSKQNDLLKNIWNTYRVPLSCNQALVEYLDGLQGAAARQRLRQAAQSANIDIVSFIRTEIPEVKDEPMETAEARKAAYDSALRRQAEIMRKNGVDPDPEKTKMLQEQKDYDERVQLVWTTMTKDEPQQAIRSAPAVKEEPKVDTARAKRKKRKSRTDISDDDSSSSDSDSDDEKPAAKKAKIAKLKAQLAEAKIAKLKAKLAKAKASKGSSSSDSESESSSSSDDSSDDDSESDSESESESESSSDSDSSSDDSSSSEESSSDSDSD